jgi:hypothetical protein
MKYLQYIIRSFYPQRSFFVSYSWIKDNTHGNGNITLLVSGRFQVRAIEGYINTFNGLDHVVILNYKKLHWWSDKYNLGEGVK